MEKIFVINETTSINDIINYLRSEKINFETGNEYLLHAGTFNGKGVRDYLNNSGGNEFHIGKTNLGNFINSISQRGSQFKDFVDIIQKEYVAKGILPDGVPRSELIKNPDYKKLLNDTYGFFVNNDPALPTDKRFLQTFPNAEKMKFWDIASERFVAEAPSGTNFRLLVGTDNFDGGKLNDTVLGGVLKSMLPEKIKRHQSKELYD